MRIVITEDEPKTREGIINVIRNFTDYEIVGVAENGEEGFRLVKEQEPDLVISDIEMPDLDGLAMLQKLRECQIGVQAVLLTGYSEFEYAKKALELQVVEYVLKPLEIKQFLAALTKVAERIRKQKAERLSPEQLLWSYVAGRNEEKERMEAAVEEHLGINNRVQSTMFLIHPGSMASETYGEIRRYLEHSLASLCMENYYFLVRPGNAGGIFVLMVDTERNRYLKKVFVSRIMPGLQEISECICSMAHIRGIWEINRVMSQLELLLNDSFSLPPESVVDQEMADSIAYKKLEYPILLENEMIQCIRSGKEDRTRRKGAEFVSLVIDSMASPDCIRDYTIRFVIGILRVMGEIRKDLNQEEQLQYILTSINKSRSRREVCKQFEWIINQVVVLERGGEEQITGNGIVLNAISYIRENYQKNIGLGDVAQFCNVRAEHLSRIFKEETGVKFVDFLTTFRISTAKRLLVTGSYRVSEVAELVGITDQKYFQRVFKKVCGVTPSEYRKENCR